MRLVTLTALPVAFAVLLCAAAHAGAQESAETQASPVFEFHSGFWINLHHFLYVEGRLRSAAKDSAAGGAQPKATLAPVSTDGLSEGQQQAWNAAVDAYAAEWSSHDLQLNGDMVLINNRLAEVENCPELSGKVRPECESGLRPNLVATLNQAAIIYRARWWPEQDRANRAWIAAVAPLVRQMGTGLAGQLSEIYESGWPRQPIRVDVVWTAGTAGAYTTLNPLHVTISSGDARNQGLASFEILFHEASHVLSGGVSEAIIRECKLRNKPVPRDLWHALLYYTTGELARREYASANPPVDATSSSYTPYADRNGLYNQDWSRYHQLLERYWQPYLDGTATFDMAIARMVSAL
jgi:hypothetical protein